MEVNMKHNPNKCLFGAQQDKFLSYFVSVELAKANIDYIKFVLEMSSLTYVWEVQKMIGMLFLLIHLCVESDTIVQDSLKFWLIRTAPQFLISIFAIEAICHLYFNLQQPQS